MTDQKAAEIEFIKPPLDGAVDWSDIPQDLPGRVILKRWPVDEVSAGGVILGGRTDRRVMGVAWVVRATDDRTEAYLHPGDSVILPEYVLSAGLLFPGEANADIVEVDARNLFHSLSLDNARVFHNAEVNRVMVEWNEARPQIGALVSGGDLDQAIRWLERFVTRRNFLNQSAVKEIVELAKQIEAADKAGGATHPADPTRHREFLKAQKEFRERMAKMEGGS